MHKLFDPSPGMSMPLEVNLRWPDGIISRISHQGTGKKQEEILWYPSSRFERMFNPRLILAFGKDIIIKKRPFKILN